MFFSLSGMDMIMVMNGKEKGTQAASSMFLCLIA